MVRSLRIEYPGAWYHVTSRGNERKAVFDGPGDREKFLAYLESATNRYGAVIHSYCLMDNHYHLLLQTPDGNLSSVMRHINGAYTTYFNARKKRSGHLFQGRYSAILVDADTYAAELSRYIVLNPVRIGLVAGPEEYPWSSYRSLAGLDEAPAWLKTDYIHGFFDTEKAAAQKMYSEFIAELVGKTDPSPLSETIAATILGDSAFVERVTSSYLPARDPSRDVPALRKLSQRPSVDMIMETAARVFGENNRDAVRAGIYLSHLFSGAKLREIAARFDITDSAVTQASSRFAARLEQDEELRKAVAKVGEELGLGTIR